MDKQKYQYESMKWLFELELIQHPQAINTIKFNILAVSKHIKEVELLIYREDKALLVLLDLNWFGRTFFKKQILEDVQYTINQLLPTFRTRIVIDPKIMKMAIDLVNKAISGGKNESTITDNSNINDKSEDKSDELQTTSKEEPGNNSSTETDLKKQP